MRGAEGYTLRRLSQNQIRGSTVKLDQYPMTDHRREPSPNTPTAVGDETWPEKMKVSVARHFLGVSHAKITSLIRSGVLRCETDPLDHRVKLIRRSDLEALMRRRTQD